MADRGPERRRSIRVTLLAGIGAAVLVGLAVSGIAAVLVLQSVLVGRADERMRAAVDAAGTVLADRAGTPLSRTQLRLLVGDDAGVVLLDAGRRPLLAVGPSWLDATRAADAAAPVPPGRITGVDAGRPVRVLRVAVAPTPLDRVVADGPPGTAHELLLVADLAPARATVRDLARIEAGVLGATAVVLAVVVPLVVRRGLRPLTEMAATATAVAAGERDRRLPPGRDAETARLADAVNGAFDARARAEDRLRSFTADAVHELRTPLTSVHGWARLHLAGGLADEAQVQRAMERIESEAARMRRLVDELALLARLDAAAPLARERVDLAAVAADVVADARVIGPGHLVGLQVAAGPAPLVDGDAARLHQVLANLVGNALAHTPPGTSITVHAGPGGTPATVALRVADSGPGLPDDVRDHAFDRFRRGRDARGRPGSGLGLAVVDGIVRAHGGTVAIRPGPGTVVDVVLPAARPSADRQDHGRAAEGDPAVLER